MLEMSKTQGKGTSVVLDIQLMKCVFDPNYPHFPCDYCGARGLECGPKYPTPRKMQEQGMFVLASLHPAFIAQPQSIAQLAYQPPSDPPAPILRVQTDNLTVPQGEYNISSSVSDPGATSPYSPPSPAMQPVSAYYTRSEQGSPNYLAPTITNPFFPTAYSDVSASPQSLASAEPEPPAEMIIELADDNTDDRRLSCELLPPIPPSIPQRNPGYTLAKSFLPFVNSMIPKEPEEVPQLEAFDPKAWEQCQWRLMQDEYLQLDEPQTLSVNSKVTGAKWLRKFHIPQKMRKRQLAGNWEFNDGETEKSVKSAPGVIV